MFDDFEPKPDKWDRAIRFILGFVVGMFAIGSLLRPFHDAVADKNLYLIIPIGLSGGLLLGLLAAWRGDRVWKWIRDWWH